MLLATRFVIMASTLISALAARADQPVQPLPKPRTGGCPYGYSSSGSYCMPSVNARAALPKVGPCPYAYTQSGSYCLASNKSARQAMPKVGPCPYGYASSGAYCLHSKTR